MSFHKTEIPGLFIYEPKVLEDSRGFFFESFNEKIFQQEGIKNNWVQDNQSSSSYGVIRGLHFQLKPHAQAKLVRVLHGNILDVVVDLRKNSPAYGKVFTIELSGSNNKHLFIPAGFAHGFSVLSERAVVFYKCDAFYHKESEAGVRFDDPALNIDWKVPPGKIIVSEKDRQLPLLSECINNFVFES